MTPQTSAGSVERGQAIRVRREELSLTIEQAAAAAGVGSETWRRYEAGGAIRRDKVRNLLKVLRWARLPDAPEDGPEGRGRDRSMWDLCGPEAEGDTYSAFLSEEYSESFARIVRAGFDITRDELRDDIESLAREPKGTHLGQLGASWFEGRLPARWLMHYDYDFMCRLLARLDTLRMRLVHPGQVDSHPLTRGVVDDLLLHLVVEQGKSAFEVADDERVDLDEADEFEYHLNGEDDEVIFALFSANTDPAPDNAWHFDRWFDDVYWGLDKEPVDGSRSDRGIHGTDVEATDEPLESEPG